MSEPPASAERSPAPPPAPPSWLLASGKFFFRFRNALFPVIFALVLIFLRPAQFLRSPSLDRIVMAAGVFVALLGQAFRLMVIGFAYVKRGGKDRQIYASSLVTAGLYAHVRNPMYVANFLMACGTGMVFGSPWMYVLVIPFFAYVYLAIVVAEEQYLRREFGAAYDEYARRVNRFCPDFRGLRRSLQGYRFQWKEVLSKEHGTAFATLAGLLVIMMWKMYWIYGWEAKKAEMTRLSWLFVPLLIGYAVIRVLKRAGKLRKEPVARG